MSDTFFHPVSGMEMPRFAGIATFMRLPHVPLDDPRINFAISERCGVTKGIEHIGLQVEDKAELEDVYARLQAADRPVLEEGETTCCYAKSEKSWIADPDGVVWEAFLTEGKSTTYGASPDLEQLSSANAAEGACCAPAVSAPAKTSCC